MYVHVLLEAAGRRERFATRWAAEWRDAVVVVVVLASDETVACHQRGADGRGRVNHGVQLLLHIGIVWREHFVRVQLSIVATLVIVVVAFAFAVAVVVVVVVVVDVLVGLVQLLFIAILRLLLLLLQIVIVLVVARRLLELVRVRFPPVLTNKQNGTLYFVHYLNR